MPKVRASSGTIGTINLPISGSFSILRSMAYVGMLRKMLKDPEIGKLIVPIVPDEARTFGMESLFRTAGIYASGGQKHEPGDLKKLLLYREEKEGQNLGE